ncbi:hypothetical protein B0O99DRAFT_523583 [Bisporella sp. PMI_857]|nr:hypothetical protein B0O99DRAFT_523583 [Bisporella sp. PMI_857]
MSTTASTRRPYTGSCHCGLTKYVIYLALPPTIPAPSPSSSVRIYKCNCTTCQKMGIFHIRVPQATEDFALLSPIAKDAAPGGLLDYKCFEGQTHWYFCSRCGVRCFSFMGEGHITTRAIPDPSTSSTSTASTAAPAPATHEQKIWAPSLCLSGDNWQESSGLRCYLSVNATTLDARQEGLDLREWHEKGWIQYLDCLEEVGEDTDVPYPGGMY